VIAGAAAELGISAARLDHSVCTYSSKAAGGGIPAEPGRPASASTSSFACLSAAGKNVTPLPRPMSSSGGA